MIPLTRRSTTWRMYLLAVTCLAATACSQTATGTSTAPPMGLQPAASGSTSGGASSVRSADASLALSTPAVDFAPAPNLTSGSLDTEAAIDGLTDVSHTYSTNASDTIVDTGGSSLGNFQSNSSFVDSSLIVKFVASYSAPVYLNSRQRYGSIGAYFNGGGAAVFDSHASYTTLGLLGPNLTPGTTYFAKLDTSTTNSKATTVTLSFLTTTGSVVTSRSFTDTDAMSQGMSAPDSVQLQPGGLGVSRIAMFGSAQPDSSVLALGTSTAPVHVSAPSAPQPIATVVLQHTPAPATPAPVATKSPAPAGTKAPTPAPTTAPVTSSIPQGIYDSCDMQSRSATCLADLDTFRNAGLTRVINYSQLYTTADELSTYLSHAATNGMKVVISVKDLYDTSSPKSTYAALSATCPSPCTTAAEFAGYIATIARSNAGTWGYYIGDETPVSSANEASTSAIYKAIKAADPTHPVMFLGTEGINTDLTNMTNALKPFSPSADVIGMDHYSIGAGDTTGASELPIAQAMHSLATSENKPSVLVLQAFGWSQPEYNREYCLPYPACGVVPTEAQMANLYKYAVEGDPNVSMLFWYSYMDMLDSSNGSTTLANVATAIRTK